MELKELKILILNSIHNKSADMDELMGRDFLKNISKTGVDRLLMSMENDGWIYLKGDTMHARKSAVEKHGKGGTQ